MPVRTVQGTNGRSSAALKICPPEAALAREAFPTRKRSAPLDTDLGELLSSAMLAADKELGDVVREVDQLSKALKCDATNLDALRVAVHPAVWSAVRSVIVERELRYLALTDDLTCLYNRRGFFAAATQQLKLARRNGQSMLMLFCDVDRLKEINDCFGHREGDLALVRIADALEEAFRDSDILARLGGDEFAILAPEASHQDLEAILRRLRKGLEKINTNEPRYALSLSVGSARFDPEHPVALADLMAEADRVMYEHKRGRPRPFLQHNPAS